MGEHVNAVTGHRPEKLGGYSDEALEKLVSFAEGVVGLFYPTMVITGMAQGWDTAVAYACINLGLPYTAAVPCMGQDSMWPEKAQKRYRMLLKKAAKVVMVSDGPYSPFAMDTRNKWMVDHANCVLALHNGTSGGTANCVRYAQSVGTRVHNFWLEWERYQNVQ